jgi:hypothetical protein
VKLPPYQHRRQICSLCSLAIPDSVPGIDSSPHSGT